MNSRILYTLSLAGALMLPAIAQQAHVDSQQPAAALENSPQSSAAQKANPDQNMSAQPIEPIRQGFWGKLNPFARKKYVQTHAGP